MRLARRWRSLCWRESLRRLSGFWPSSPSARAQLGADLDGEAAGDESGGFVALSADGTRLAVGAALNDTPGGGGDEGHVSKDPRKH